MEEMSFMDVWFINRCSFLAHHTRCFSYSQLYCTCFSGYFRPAARFFHSFYNRWTSHFPYHEEMCEVLRTDELSAPRSLQCVVAVGSSSSCCPPLCRKGEVSECCAASNEPAIDGAENSPPPPSFPPTASVPQLFTSLCGQLALFRIHSGIMASYLNRGTFHHKLFYETAAWLHLSYLICLLCSVAKLWPMARFWPVSLQKKNYSAFETPIFLGKITNFRPENLMNPLM